MANGKASAKKAGSDGTTDAYLKTLGDRVRRIRAQRGMTRRILARDSGVSERYLAQLESGRGNVSILLLRQIAAAMGVPTADLVHDGPERSVEFALAQQLLSGLETKELTEAYRLLAQQFGREGGEERGGRIALIGLRGAGKSTLGRIAADRLGLPFVEMAREIAAEAGTTLSEVFSLYGQAAYRRYERRALERVIASHPGAIIATGGSLVSEPGTFAMLLRSCHTVWIKASPHEHMARVMAQGDMRPMKGSPEAMEDLKRILDGRHALYSKADAAIDTSGKSVAECTEALVRVSQTLLGRAEAA
jgi:XRE family transcriptional regulator, aerobic/anaerobic benzoate catabolism transcriptional regulator